MKSVIQYDFIINETFLINRMFIPMQVTHLIRYKKTTTVLSRTKPEFISL